MTRKQFEAHVRAAAEKEYPDRVLDNGIYRATELRFHNERHTYIATRMEHEWPVVAALYAIMEAHGPGNFASERIYEGGVNALAPYTTKPIER